MSERKIVLASTSAVNGVCDSEGFNHEDADSSELVSFSAARHMASGFPVLVKSHCLTVLHLYVTYFYSTEIKDMLPYTDKCYS